MDQPNTRTLVAAVELKDRRFRIAQTVFMAMVFIAMAAVILFQFRIQAGIQEQLKQQAVLLQAQKQNTDELKKNTTDQLSKVSAQLDCIASFFATRNRTEATITDLEQCTIVRSDGSIVQPNFNRGASSPSNSTTTPAPRNSNGASQGQTPSNPQQPTTPTVPNTPAVPDPVEILGIPICVPFTDRCVR